MKVLKFSASWCAPCKMMSKMMEGANLSIEVEEVDIDENIELASSFQVRGVPTLVKVDDDGKEISRHVGMFKNPAALEGWFNG